MRALHLISRSATKPGTLELVEELGREIFGIQIAADDDRRIRRIALEICQYLIELLLLNPPHTAALQVRVIYDQRAAGELKFGDQRDAAAKPALHQRNGRRDPSARLPESGLLLEAQDARF
jgi:hypothetical protein